jgi:hypothetical protein
MEPDTSRTNRDLVRGRRLLWLAPTFVVLWFSAIQMHLEPVFASLDSSWLGALSYFAVRRLQYGTEVIFTYGPLAYLGTGVYSGYLFWERVIWELGFKAVIAGFLCWVIGRLPRTWGAIFLGFCLLFVLPGFPEVFYFLSVTILVVFLLRGSQGIHFADILAIMLLSAVSLMKYNYLILVLLGIGAATAAALSKQSFARAGWICLTFLAGFLLCWKWASQDFRHLVPYLRNGFEVSFGYKEAMGMAASSNLSVALGLVALAAVFVQLAFITIRRGELRVTLIALFFVGEMFLDWQHGFIRADQHVVTFFELCPVALLSLWATGATGRVPKWPLFSTTAVVACACLGGMYLQDRSLITHCFWNAANQLQSGWNLAFHGARIEGDLKQQLTQKKAQNALPRVKQEVGQASLDVLGYEQAAALLNDLNYTPRPIFQSYTAYTERLIEQNRKFYQSARAPAYAFVKYQTIDGRYPALDDAAVFRELLYHYSPLFTENGYSLWKRLPRSEEAEAVVVSEGTTTFGEEVMVPQSGIIWIELQMQNSIRGKIANMLYKPPRLQMTVRPGNGPIARYRLVRAMASSGFIISPAILTTDDLIATAQGVNSPGTKSFMVWLPSRDRKFYQPAIRYRMIQLPPVPRREP